jgi:hypothetical protein
VQRFYEAVGAFYRAAAQFAVAKLPFNDKVLENSRFVNFEKCREHEFTMVEFFLQRFPDHLEMSVEEQEKLQEQFIDYQLLSNHNIPQHVCNDATVKTDEDGTACLFRMDVIWGQSADGTPQFDLLARVALTVLCLPHSNAEERVFSMIGKNKRAERSSLQVKGTLSSIMTVKLADLNAKTFMPPVSVLKAAKSATYEYNKAHKRKL